MNYRFRQDQILRALRDEELDALLVTHHPNINYLCGFTGSAGALLLGEKGIAFFTDGRYDQQAHAEVNGARVVISKGPLPAAAIAGLAQTCGSQGRKSRIIGFESDHISVASRETLNDLLPKRNHLRRMSGMVDILRAVKDPQEIERLRAAARLGTSLLDSALRVIKPGIAETAVAAELEYASRRAGAQGMSFDTIVAAGPRSALPHGRATVHPIPHRGFVVLDFGVMLRSYCSDMTRTVHVGRPSREMRAAYEAVRDAQQAGISAVRSGVPARQVDRVARRTLRRAGLARYFTHSTGHGVGLEIHEPPRLAKDSEGCLKPGMVITIEPGVYLPGKGGVRIEDMVLVTQSGAEVLTLAPKELIQL